MDAEKEKKLREGMEAMLAIGRSVPNQDFDERLVVYFVKEERVE